MPAKKTKPAASPSVSGVTSPSTVVETPALSPHLSKRQRIAALEAENAALKSEIAILKKS